MGRKSKNLKLKPENKESIKDNKLYEKINLEKSGRKSKELIIRNVIKIYFNSLETEYNYFKEIKDKLENFKIIDLKLEIEKAQSKGGKSSLELLEYSVLNKNEKEETWIVFDKDDFEIDSVITKANKCNIKPAFSNPCFELWFLNYFDYRETFLSPKECLKLTKEKFKKELKKEYVKNEKWFKILEKKTETAVRNSKKQHKEIEKSIFSPSRQNPCTLIYILVEKLLKVLKYAD